MKKINLGKHENEKKNKKKIFNEKFETKFC